MGPGNHRGPGRGWAGARYRGERAHRARGWLLGRDRESGRGRVPRKGRAGTGQGWGSGSGRSPPGKRRRGRPVPSPAAPPAALPSRSSLALTEGKLPGKAQKEIEGRYSCGCSRPEKGRDGGKRGGDPTPKSCRPAEHHRHKPGSAGRAENGHARVFVCVCVPGCVRVYASVPACPQPAEPSLLFPPHLPAQPGHCLCPQQQATKHLPSLPAELGDEGLGFFFPPHCL